jgi:hypothetical protein
MQTANLEAFFNYYFQVELAGSAGAAHIASLAACRFDCVASDSNRLPWQPTNPQRFRPHSDLTLELDHY